MNQIKWNKIDSMDYEILRADLMSTFWTEDVENPAYPKDHLDEDEEETLDDDSPNNLITTSFSLGFTNDYRRGISGYIYEKLLFNNRDSLQAQFWSASCDLFDCIHRFTIAWNNDAWFSVDMDEYPEDDATDEEWDKYNRLCDEIYEEKEDAMLMLETDIIELSREICKKSEGEIIEYSDINKFIKLDKKIDWFETDWDDASKKLLSMLESYFLAVKDKVFFSSYMDEFLPNQQAQHFDWRINPMLRDIFLGFLISNPFLVNEQGVIIEDQQLFELVFEGKDNLKEFYDTNVNVGSKFENQIAIKDYKKILDKKFKTSPMNIDGHDFDEVKDMVRRNWGKNFIET